MKKLLLLFFVAGCAGNIWTPPSDFTYNPIKTQNYEIATWQKINSPKNNHVHIYIEGDGNSYNAYGRPTNDPTPHGTFVRDLAIQDNFDNVVYMARPCQFIMDKNCETTDWTTGRFSRKIIDSMSNAMGQVAKNKHITIIGYSGGALISGLIINQNNKLKIEKWITIAGVLNHNQWTQYFDDEPLNESLDMNNLPNVSQKHFVAEYDDIVPYELSEKWTGGKNIEIIKNASHDDFGDLKIFD